MPLSDRRCALYYVCCVRVPCPAGEEGAPDVMTFYQEDWDMGPDGKCIPGCYPEGQWCDQPGAGQLGMCSFPPSKLCDALLRQEGGFAAGNNNEIVVDTSSVEADPANMIAGFFMGGQHDDDVRAAYRAFIHRYGLDPERAPPLMRMDLEGEEAFILED